MLVTLFLPFGALSLSATTPTTTACPGTRETSFEASRSESATHKGFSLSQIKNISRSSSTSTSTSSSSRSSSTIVAGIVGPRRSSSRRNNNDNSSATVTRAAGAADKLSGIVFEPFNEVRDGEFFLFNLFNLQKNKRTLASRSTLFLNPLSSPTPQVKPELANVSKLAEAADVSLARAGFTSHCEAALNEQIK